MVERSTATSAGHVLVVDDEPSLIAAYSRSLTSAGFVVDEASNGKRAIELLRDKRFDAIVSDISMPELDGIGLLRLVRERDLDVPVVLVSGNPSLETAVQAVEFGALRYLQKPLELSTLVGVVKQAVSRGKMARSEREAVELHSDRSKELGDRESLGIRFDRALAGLWMAYQPIVRCSERSIMAYEALLRSSEPTLQHPGAIVGAAQRLQRLPDLGRAVRRHVANSVSRSTIPLVLVNLHPHDLLDDGLFAATAPLTCIAHKVVLQMTERASLEDIPDVQVRMARLRKLGFRIALDDMGAGYAGLTSVAKLAPEIMKLDMGLVRSIEGSPIKQQLVTAMVGLCAEMDVMAIADGIETTAERDCLLKLGCDVMQGDLFGRPQKPFPDALFRSDA